MEKKKTNTTTRLVRVIKPAILEDAVVIAESLLAGQVVLFNLEGVSWITAQRIIDFVAGACCAADGICRKISDCIFIVAPFETAVTGDFHSERFPEKAPSM